MWRFTDQIYKFNYLAHVQEDQKTYKKIKYVFMEKEIRAAFSMSCPNKWNNATENLSFSSRYSKEYIREGKKWRTKNRKAVNLDKNNNWTLNNEVIILEENHFLIKVFFRVD